MSINLTELLKKAGFQVQETSFTDIIPDADLRELVKSDLPPFLVPVTRVFHNYSSCLEEGGA